MSGPPAAVWVGVVLAGGASRRFGRAKWREEVGGRPMAARALDALAPHARARLVVGSDPALASLGVPVREDARPGRGPLAGLETALLWARDAGATHLLALACDLPLAGPDTVGAVAAAAAPGDEAVVPRAGGRPQPLCAAYALEALPTVGRLLDREEGASLHRLLADLRVRWMEAAALPGGSDAFLNVNRPAERERAERLLGPRPPAGT